MSYKRNKPTKTSINVNEAYVADELEAKMRRMRETKEPIGEVSPIVYTERKDGVQPQYNIKTDRFEVALDAMDKVSKSYRAQRENRIKEALDKTKIPDGNKNEGTSASTSD